MKNKKSLKLFLPAVLALIMIVLIIGSSIGKSENINKNGEKYGKFPTDKGLNQLLESDSLDLIAVVATNGKEGYIKKTDIDLLHRKTRQLMSQKTIMLMYIKAMEKQ